MKGTLETDNFKNVLFLFLRQEFVGVVKSLLPATKN